VHEVADPRPARVLDDDAVARPQLSLERALDRVEGAAGDRHVAVEAVGGELGRGERLELGQLRGDAVQPVRRVDPRERAGEPRKERRIGIAAREVADARRQAGGGRDAHGRKRGDRGPAPAVGDDEPAVAERAVRGRGRRRADPEPGRERAHGRKPRARGQAAVGDRGLDRGRDLGRPGAGVDNL
jgi:hypothetical protein